MENILPSAEQEALVFSFLEIAVGQSIEVARHFLQAANWRIEDAIQQFYVEDARHVANCSSHTPLVGYTPLLSDHNYSELEERILNVNDRQGDGDERRPPLPVITAHPTALLPAAVATSAAYVPTPSRRKRRTRAEMVADASASMFDVVNPCSDVPIARRARRSRAQPATGASLSTPCVKSTHPATRRPRRTAAQMAAAATATSIVEGVILGNGLLNAGSLCNRPSEAASQCVITGPCEAVPRRQRRTRAEIDAGLAVPSPQLAICRRRRAHSEMAIAASSPISTAGLHGADSLRQRIPAPRRRTRSQLGIEVPCHLPLSLESNPIASTSSRRTRLQLAAASYTPVPSGVDAVPKALGGVIEASNASGYFTFLLQGQLYHYLPNLLAEHDAPKFMQLYFYDGATKFDSRCRNFENLEPDLIAAFITFTSANPYARFFRSLRTFPIQDTSQIRIFTNPGLDQRVYNAPTSDEVAAIIVDDPSSDSINSPHIVVYGKAAREHRILHYFGCYDPLQYPLLFTKGETGWHQGLKRITPGGHSRCDELPFPLVPGIVQHAQDILAQEAAASISRPSKGCKSLSCREYYAYRFQIRPNNFLINMGRIFVQYIVDMYVKVENTRLDYLKHNQTLLRSELYQGVVDSVNDGNRSATEIGRRVILPASFIGGPRDKKCRYLNAMALVQRFGKPDIFLTMTCNPNWPEIKDNLLPGENTDHRPDLVARIFNAKVRLLRKLIAEEQIFGPVAARVDVIEFQKRGLPHLHMLIILAHGSKISNPDSFDQYVSMELPPVENTRLRSLVERHMMHGPCGKLGPNCSCMRKVGKDSKCKFNYPKKHAEFTTCTDDSYPTYRRRANGDFVTVKHKQLDNRWVVPYNPYLLSAFDCHLNVEICSTIQAVKYLYKYIYKGHDKVCFAIGSNGQRVEDEITTYQSGRWVSGPESAWRLFEFDLYSMKPAVIPLQLHLPHMHVIRFAANADLENIVNNENRSATMLTEFFTANRVLEKAPLYLYSEFPRYFTWLPGIKAWKERSGPECVGRLTYASPCEGERYYLRLLLINVRGSTSFDDLLTFEGVRSATFKEAAEKHGILQRDDYTEFCMRDAIEVQMPGTLRRLFATLLIFCDQLDPRALWDQFYSSLSEDFSHKYKGQSTKILHLTYSDIAGLLEGMGRSMEDFNLHVYSDFADLGLRMTRDITDALDAPVPHEYVTAHTELNAEQRLAYDSILHHVEHCLPGAFFIDGPGGTGKTFLYCALYAILRGMGKIVLSTATSGIAAANIPAGRTAHSRFKIPINQTGLVTCNVSKQSALASLLKECTLIIWDEASMANKADIESLDRLLQDLCDSEEIFGGKIVVFGGDFRQVLPVVPHKSQLEVVNASLVNSYLWPKLLKFRLHTNIRAKEDAEFACFLLELGNGDLQRDVGQEIVLPAFISCYPIEKDSFARLTEVVFPEMQQPNFNSDIFAGRAILTPTSEAVDSINAALISDFPGSTFTYTSFDAIVDDNCNLYPTEFLNSLCPSGMSPHELVLKEGCPVILLCNLDPSNGLCNGTRLICREFRKNVILCEVAVGCNKGMQVFIPRINLRPPESTYPFQFERKQFPIKLCFAMTINKSQGQTLERVCVYLAHPCFSHGQLYVAFSRARTRSGLTIFLPPSHDHESGQNKVMNVVSFDVLHRARRFAELPT